MLSLKELQMLAETEYSVEDTRQDLNRIARYFRKQSYHNEVMDLAFVKERQLPKYLVDECDLFFIEEDYPLSNLPEDFKVESLGLVKKNYIVFSGRIIYPIKDVKGNIMGYCGWDKFAQPKYLDSKNHGYKAKSTTLFGMEKMEEYYRSDKPIYVTEGIVCCLYLRSIGLQALAILGSNLTSYVVHILKRFGKRLVIIPDNDIVGKEENRINTLPAGEHFVRQAKKVLPLATIIQSVQAKDVDDTRKKENQRYEKLFINELKQVAINPFYFFETIRVR